MPDARDVVIIGGGHNGLVTAFYLAKAGYNPSCLSVALNPAGLPSRKSSIRDFVAQF